MKKRFYYNGKLVRTSETHNYTHAVIQERANGTFRLIACSKSKDLAEKRMMSEMSNAKHNLKAYEERLKKMQRGCKVPHINYVEGFPDENTISGCMWYVKYYQDRIKHYYETAKVVELEQR